LGWSKPIKKIKLGCVKVGRKLRKFKLPPHSDQTRKVSKKERGLEGSEGLRRMKILDEVGPRLRSEALASENFMMKSSLAHDESASCQEILRRN
jgi:hypothetical protein